MKSASILLLMLFMPLSACGDRLKPEPLEARVGEKAAVGYPCTLWEHNEETMNHLDAEASECRSRACLHVGMFDGQAPKSLCTKSCERSSDCPLSTPSCQSGFVCAAPFQISTLACCGMCVCADDVGPVYEKYPCGDTTKSCSLTLE